MTASMESEKSVNLVQENMDVHSYLVTKLTLEYVQDLRDSFNNNTICRQEFLGEDTNTPTYNDQIDTTIVLFMANPPDEMSCKCGHWERMGNRHASLMQES